MHQQRAACQTAAPVCASIFGGAGGPLRTVGFDGEIRNEEEMREHHDRACDDLLAHCPPVDAETLVAWRDEYVSKLGDIYAQRRTLGMMLASSGSEITVSSATPQHHGGGFDDAKAIGAGSEGAQTALQEQYHKNLTLVEGETMAVTVLKQVMEEKINTDNVELARVVPGKGFHIATTEEVGSVLERLS